MTRLKHKVMDPFIIYLPSNLYIAGKPHNSLIFILFDDHLLASHLQTVTQKVYDDNLSCKETFAKL